MFISKFEVDLISCLCVFFQSSPGLFTGSAWTRAAPGEASAPAWLYSRSSLWWLSICSLCTPWISKSHSLALRMSSIIRSPPLPGQGRHHRARVANQTSYPQTSWTLGEEASCAFFFQRRRSFQKQVIPVVCSSAQKHAATITFKSVTASLVFLILLYVTFFKMWIHAYYLTCKSSFPVCGGGKPLNNAVVLLSYSLCLYLKFWTLST